LAPERKICPGQTKPEVVWENKSEAAVEVYLDVASAWFEDWKFTGEYIAAPLPPRPSR
jgi:hypothetical protein